MTHSFLRHLLMAGACTLAFLLLAEDLFPGFALLYVPILFFAAAWGIAAWVVPFHVRQQTSLWRRTLWIILALVPGLWLQLLVRYAGLSSLFLVVAVVVLCVALIAAATTHENEEK